MCLYRGEPTNQSNKIKSGLGIQIRYFILSQTLAAQLLEFCNRFFSKSFTTSQAKSQYSLARFFPLQIHFFLGKNENQNAHH